MTKVLFICLGNICRSSMAEGVFKEFAKTAGRGDEFEVESAGTSSWHIGQAPDSEAQATILARGIDISDQRARQLKAADFNECDYIVAMDRQNKANLIAAAPPGSKAQISLLLDHAPEQSERNVPDPWSCSQDVFETSLDLVEAGCAGLLKSIPVKG